jgi:hypothetical protein
MGASVKPGRRADRDQRYLQRRCRVADPRQFDYLLVALGLTVLGLLGYFFWTRRATKTSP